MKRTRASHCQAATRRGGASYHPQIEALEGRLPPGEVLGLWAAPWWGLSLTGLIPESRAAEDVRAGGLPARDRSGLQGTFGTALSFSRGDRPAVSGRQAGSFIAEVVARPTGETWDPTRRPSSSAWELTGMSFGPGHPRRTGRRSGL
jgi:hypothetical protein